MDFDDNVEAGETGIDDILVVNNNTDPGYVSLKDCVIFLVDCSESMHKVFEGTSGIPTTPITSILSVCESFLKTKIISNESDLFSMVLYNTAKTNNEMQFEGVNKEIQVTSPNAQLIKRIQNLHKETSPALVGDSYKEKLNEIFPPCPPDKDFLLNAIWICHSIMKNYEKTKFNRRIFLFTDNDNPLSGNANLDNRNMLIQRVKDMVESEITIEIFPMNFSDDSFFDMKKFYYNIIPVNDNEEENTDNLFSIEKCEDRLRELTKRIRQKEIKKRAIGRCPFYLTGNEKIYLNLYSSVRKATKGKSYNIDMATNKVLSSLNQVTCQDTGANLYPNQIGTYHLYGNKKVVFSKEDMAKIKSLDEPGLKLMGFKSISKLKPYYNVRESYFLYPNEAISGGSSQLCDALIKQMTNKGKCAIVKFVAREGSAIKICALLPQKESFDEDYFQTPPGFNMIVLPFADDIRSNSELMAKFNDMNSIEVTKEQEDIAKKLIKKMNITFDCRNFENVSIQKFYSTLQNIALEEDNDIAEEVEDLINPDNNALEQVLKGADEEFREAFGLNGPTGTEERGTKKHTKGKKEVKNRYEDPEGDVYSDKKLIRMYDNNGFKGFSVKLLKEICQARRLPIKNKKKAEMIEMLKENLKLK